MTHHKSSFNKFRNAISLIMIIINYNVICYKMPPATVSVSDFSASSDAWAWCGNPNLWPASRRLSESSNRLSIEAPLPYPSSNLFITHCYMPEMLLIPTLVSRKRERETGAVRNPIMMLLSAASKTSL